MERLTITPEQADALARGEDITVEAKVRKSRPSGSQRPGDGTAGS